jgi:hypothetical protein
MPGDPGYLAALRNGNTPVSYGAYVDLNYMCQLGGTGMPNYVPAPGAPAPQFHWAGHPRSGLRGTEPYAGNLQYPFASSPPSLLASVYDTWSFHYENDGVAQFPGGTADTGTNGFDDPMYDPYQNLTIPANGVVDDPTEMETSPPYPVPLRGIQVKIRVFESSSRQVRQRTVEQDFLPK